MPDDGHVPRPPPPAPADPEALLEEAGRAAEFLKAFAHDGRLLILVHLCHRDHTVTELEQLTHSRQAAVSQQLARLRYERLVSTRREGNQIIYSLADERVRATVALLGRLFALPVDRSLGAAPE